MSDLKGCFHIGCRNYPPQRTLRTLSLKFLGVLCVLSGVYFPSSPRTSRAPSTIAVSFANATSRGRCRQPQSGIDDEPLGRHDFERLPDAIGDERRRLDVLILDVDDAQAQLERRLELLEQLQVLVAAPREFERDAAAPWRRGSRGTDSGSCPPRTACRSGCRSRCAAEWSPRPPSTSALTRANRPGRSSGKPE